MKINFIQEVALQIHGKGMCGKQRFISSCSSALYDQSL